jgi:hypothetical protein
MEPLVEILLREGGREQIYEKMVEEDKKMSDAAHT